MTIYERIEFINEGFRDLPVTEWAPKLLDTTEWTDLGNISFGWYATVFAMLTPSWLFKLAWNEIADAAFKEDVVFMQTIYLPELINATKNIHVSFKNW